MKELKKAIINHLNYLTEDQIKDLLRIIWLMITGKR